MMEDSIDIYVVWDDFGYQASSPSLDKRSPHAAGPALAAEELAAAVFGRGEAVLERVRRGYYRAARRGT
jgi:hypothetical protein